MGVSVLEWCRRAFGLQEHDLTQLDAALQRLPPDPDLLYIPRFYRERDELLVDRPAAGFVGLKPDNGSLDLLLAAIKAVVFNAALMLEELKSAREVTKAVISGGVCLPRHRTGHPGRHPRKGQLSGRRRWRVAPWRWDDRLGRARDQRIAPRGAARRWPRSSRRTLPCEVRGAGPGDPQQPREVDAVSPVNGTGWPSAPNCGDGAKYL